MKKLMTLLLGIALLSAAGCGYLQREQETETPAYLLYYREADLNHAASGDALRAESVTLEGVDTEDTQAMAAALVAKLLEVDGWGSHHPLDHQCSIEI